MNFSGILWILGLFLAGIAIFGLLSGNFTGLLTHPNTPSTIRIGAILPLTGDAAIVGISIQEGILIAQDEINQAGGINGKPVNVIFEDDRYDNTITLTATQKLLTSDKVAVGIVALVHGAKAVTPTFEQAKVPLVVAWDSTKEIEDSNYVFSTGFSTELAGKKMADFAFDRLKLRRLAIVLHEDEWSQIIAPAFRKQFESKGGQITLEEKVVVGENDFRTLITKIKNEKADGVYFPLIPVNSDAFIKQTKELDLNAQLLSGDALIPDVITAAGLAAEGIYYTNIFTEENERSSQLTRRFHEKFGADPVDLPMVTFGYDTLMAIQQAAEVSGGNTSEHITNGLYFVDMNGSGGRIKINPNGLSNRVEKVHRIENGESVPIE